MPERIVLEVEVDPSKAIQSFGEINNKVQEVKQTTSEIADSFTSAIPGLNQYIERQTHSLSEQAEGLLAAQNAIVQAKNERDRQYQTRAYANSIDTYKMTAQSTQDMISDAQALASKLSNGIMDEL